MTCQFALAIKITEVTFEEPKSKIQEPNKEKKISDQKDID